MIAFDLPSRTLRDEMFNLLSKKMLVLKCGEKSIRLRPPLTFSLEDADTAVSYIYEAICKL